MELVKQPGKTLGFSIAGGRGSTPAYEDVDEVILNSCHLDCFKVYCPLCGLQSIFVTKIAPGGLAEADGRLRLGDKLLQVRARGTDFFIMYSLLLVDVEIIMV